jgi:hypothetical protein
MERGLGPGITDAAVLLKFGLGYDTLTIALRVNPQQGSQSGDIGSGWGLVVRTPTPA